MSIYNFIFVFVMVTFLLNNGNQNNETQRKGERRMNKCVSEVISKENGQNPSGSFLDSIKGGVKLPSQSILLCMYMESLQGWLKPGLYSVKSKNWFLIFRFCII